MALPKPLSQIFQYVDKNKDKFLERLRYAIAKESIPTSEAGTDQILQLIEWMNDLIKSLGVATELRTIEMDNGSKPLPPIILGNFETGNCPNKSTVLFYGHLDVKAAEIEDGWKNSPFELFEENGSLFGRGLLSKGSLLAWLNSIEAYRSLGLDCPINIKFIIESSGTLGNLGLKHFLLSEKEKFLAKTDYVCVSNGTWLQPDEPCIVFSLKGVCTFIVQIECSRKNLDFNSCNGIVQEALVDLIYLLKNLVDENGILNASFIGIDSGPLTEDEMQMYTNADFDLIEFMDKIGAKSSLFKGNIPETLKYRLTKPSVTIHSITGSFTEDEMIIPAFAAARISISTSSDQIPEEIFMATKKFLEQKWKDTGSQNALTISLEKTINSWNSNIEHDHYKAAVKAITHIYKKPPSFVRNGNTIPLVKILEETIDRSIVLLPISSADNFEVNESLQVSNYINATKMFAAYLYEMGELPRVWSKSSASFVSCRSTAEVCVCGVFGENIQAVLGDVGSCACPDQSKKVADKVQREDERPISEPSIPEEQLRPTSNEEVALIQKQPSLIPMKCQCLFVPDVLYPKIPIGDVRSCMSNASTMSREPIAPKVIELKLERSTTSSETTKCTCIPKTYQGFIGKEIELISSERQRELIKSMKSVDSEMSGKSALEQNIVFQRPKMAMLGCVCPEESTETVFEEAKQIERMRCSMKMRGDRDTQVDTRNDHVNVPLTDEHEIEQIERMDGSMKMKEDKDTQVEMRNDHMIGPPTDEQGSESLCNRSCSAEELIRMIPQCDCRPRNSPAVPEHTSPNFDNELD